MPASLPSASLRGYSRTWCTPNGVEIRIKHENSALMHMKSYEIDGLLLRTGAANFSASGLKRQDNDLIVIKDVQAAIKFKHAFEARFASGITLPATAVR